MAAPAGIESRGFAVGTFEDHDPAARIMLIGGVYTLSGWSMEVSTGSDAITPTLCQ